jgi:hypothetical protein
VQWKNRVYYLLCATTPEGKQKQSMSFLLNQWIETHADRKLILDYEGSSLLTIAKYYANTGAVNAPYPVISHPAVLFDALSFLKKKFK